MATIKAIEARSVCYHSTRRAFGIMVTHAWLSVVGACEDIRFKNNGLDLIEVQDNGHGISPSNYETVALKHYTSKLATFEDLSSLQTFGFRGEALSSLCALSDFHIITAQADQAPKATRLDFEVSGKLKSTQVVAGQKGTTASVENLFQRLPVRRRELEKNIKREYGKVLGLLHAYACISTGVRFSVKNQMPKGKSVVVFATKSNPTTKENISNVYGAKTLLALMPLDLELEFEPSIGPKALGGPRGGATNMIFVHGYISKPVVGEGRQTPDRQMFFVNSRPCGLPQIARAFNEVYRSFNISQSPFIFANFEMDTNAYDVNVSPDKRTILLHDAGALIESLKTSLTELFESQDQTVPQSQLWTPRQTTMKHLVNTNVPLDSVPLTSDDSLPAMQSSGETMEKDEEAPESSQKSMRSLLQRFDDRCRPPDESTLPSPGSSGETEPPTQTSVNEPDKLSVPVPISKTQTEKPDESSQKTLTPSQEKIQLSQINTPQSSPNVIQNAFSRMRPTRPPAEIATITIGDKTVTSTIGYTPPHKRKVRDEESESAMLPAKHQARAPPISKLGRTLKSFAAPGSQFDDRQQPQDGEEEEESVAESSRSESQAVLDEEHHEASDSDNAVEPMEEDEEGSASDSDKSYVDDLEQKAREEQKVVELIRAAEEAANVPSEHNIERAKKISRRSRGKNSTVELQCSIDGSIAKIETQLKLLQENLESLKNYRYSDRVEAEDSQQQDSETKLSLTVSKDDFSRMRIVGQFNLGFILAIRPANTHVDSQQDGIPCNSDELFIIDQHASDEKYNFERLQTETVVQNQRLVKPKILDLTAVEEEIIIDNIPALEKNGFIVDIDTSGDEPIGRRCKLVSLPLSKEVVFNTRDLEELIVVLSESPQHHRHCHGSTTNDNDAPLASSSQFSFSDLHVPRPSKVRKMFAMRACRSSIMIGKSLSIKQMEKVVRHMGMIDKPWNCPHGRPTMRHLMSLERWREWDEWPEMEMMDDGSDPGSLDGQGVGVWRQFLEKYSDLED
ncbi:ATP-binding mismatch repair protein [Emydomyces testavorans]|uniref:ATP-binding mismatch repair protein n=1 Tax=Emydomyces testavorans TaxID=2070801 RepID=A0AAF0DEW3_9EURO|nr:ATP-binding mismatch repair protein [Emydomyces testavorans]